MARVRFVGPSALLVVLAACGSVSTSGDGGQTGGANGGGGGHTGGASGGGGTTGVGGEAGKGCAGQGGNTCSTNQMCPFDYSTAACSPAGSTCCAIELQLTCGDCAGGTCHWLPPCFGTGQGGATGSGGRGGTGGGNSGAGGGGGSAASDCGGCDSATQFCHVTVGGAVGSPPSYQCMALPSACATNPTCACLLGKVGCGNLCSMGDGGITVTCQAP